MIVLDLKKREKRKYSRVGIVYGWCGSSALHWQTWLARKCRKLGMKTAYPKLPNKQRPKLGEWMTALGKALPRVDEETALVGHSLGCNAILRFLKRKSVKRVGLVVLVAPLSLKQVLESDAPFVAPFLRDLDCAAARKKALRIVVLVSNDDSWSDLKDVRMLARKLGAELRVVRGGGHLNASAGFHSFPEVLELLISK